MSALLDYLPLLLLTLAVEVPVARALGGGRRGIGRVAFYLNLTTHPLATAAMLTGAPFLEVELAVLLAELLGYRLVGRLSLPRSVVVALSGNLLSVVLGFLLWSLLWG